MRKKVKRSPAGDIEQKNPHYEQAYIKYAGHPLIPAALHVAPRQAAYDFRKVRQKWEKNSKRKFSLVHTHPYYAEESGHKINDHSPLPSPADLRLFLKEDNAKSMIIAQQNGNTGKVEGYFVLRKTRKTKPLNFSNMDFLASETELRKKYLSKGVLRGLLTGIGNMGKVFLNVFDIHRSIFRYYRECEMARKLDNPEIVSQAVQEISDKYNLKYRYVPAKGYETGEGKINFVKGRGLEDKVSGTTTILGLLGSILFLTSNLTWNIIGGLNQSYSDIIGVVLFFIGITGALFFFSKRRLWIP